MVEHRNRSKFKKIEIISTNFFDHNGMKVEMNKRKVSRPKNMWKINNTILNN